MGRSCVKTATWTPSHLQKPAIPGRYTAQRPYSKHSGGSLYLSPTQEKILKLLRENGGKAEQSFIMNSLHLKKEALEQETALLRHMEKVRGHKEGKKAICICGKKGMVCYCILQENQKLF